MEYRTLGRTGIRVSTIALGCEGFMHKTAEEVKAASERDHWMTADEAKDFGLVDKIITAKK